LELAATRAASHHFGQLALEVILQGRLDSLFAQSLQALTRLTLALQPVRRNDCGAQAQGAGLLPLSKREALLSVESTEVFRLHHINAALRNSLQQLDNMITGDMVVLCFSDKAAPD